MKMMGNALNAVKMKWMALDAIIADFMITIAKFLIAHGAAATALARNRGGYD